MYALVMADAVPTDDAGWNAMYEVDEDHPELWDKLMTVSLSSMCRARNELCKVGVVGPFGIPEHKLMSNDDWHVTPEEIRAGFDHAARCLPGWPQRLEPNEHHIAAEDLIEFFARSLDHNGFEVH